MLGNEMRLIAITTCTDRKRFPVPQELDASGLPRATQAILAGTWRKRTKSACAVGTAMDVYCGRSFQEAVLAARSASADFRIISGGLGLIRGDQAIPSYSLSLVRKSPEFIGARVIGQSFDSTRWWREVQFDHARQPIAELLRTSSDAIVLIGISNSYLTLLAEDLASIDPEDVSRVRLIGLGIEDVCPPHVRHCILPYDDRLDGPDSKVRGTRGDFSSRAMRHFTQCVLGKTNGSLLRSHKAAVDRCLAGWRHPKLISRPSKTDDEIIKLIKKNWKAIEGKSSLGLRYLRDIEKVACEQGRFRLLFNRAAKQVME